MPEYNKDDYKTPVADFIANTLAIIVLGAMILGSLVSCLP